MTCLRRDLPLGVLAPEGGLVLELGVPGELGELGGLEELEELGGLGGDD